MKYKSIILVLVTFFVAINLNAQQKEKASNVLIVYYSRSGNTQTMAKMIQAETGGDMIAISLVKNYPEDYGQLVKQYKEEVRTKKWPAIKTRISNMEKYDYIFIGSPNWGSSIAPPVSSFLNSHNLKGKVIIPFMTHGGGGFGHSINDIKLLCPQSDLKEGLSINGSSVESSEASIRHWLQKLKLSRQANSK